MCRNVESLSCPLETDVILCVNYNSIEKTNFIIGYVCMYRKKLCIGFGIICGFRRLPGGLGMYPLQIRGNCYNPLFSIGFSVLEAVFLLVNGV